MGPVHTRERRPHLLQEHGGKQHRGVRLNSSPFRCDPDPPDDLGAWVGYMELVCGDGHGRQVDPPYGANHRHLDTGQRAAVLEPVAVLQYSGPVRRHRPRLLVRTGVSMV